MTFLCFFLALGDFNKGEYGVHICIYTSREENLYSNLLEVDGFRLPFRIPQFEKLTLLRVYDKQPQFVIQFILFYYFFLAEPCGIKPCQHNGKCDPLWDGGYSCDCTGTGYTGVHCESGVIEMPGQIMARVDEVYPNIMIDARPEMELLLTVSGHQGDIIVSPNPIFVRSPATFSVLVFKRGIYELTFDVAGPSAGDYNNVTETKIRADDVFSRLKLRQSGLPSGCFWYQLKFGDYVLWFSSTSPWFRRNFVVFTTGVVMLVHDPIHLPMSSDGVEIRSDSTVNIGSLRSEEVDGIQLENHKDVPCEILVLSERDKKEFHQARSALRSLFKTLEEMLPFYIHLSLETNALSQPFVYQPQILSGNAVQEEPVCEGAPTVDERLYVVLKFDEPFVVSVLDENVKIPAGKFCIVVDVLSADGRSVTFMFSDDFGANLHDISLVKYLQNNADLELFVLGLSFSSPGLNHILPVEQGLPLWNGAKLFPPP